MLLCGLLARKFDCLSVCPCACLRERSCVCVFVCVIVCLIVCLFVCACGFLSG